eukprot:g5589.t1
MYCGYPRDNPEKSFSCRYDHKSMCTGGEWDERDFFRRQCPAGLYCPTTTTSESCESGNYCAEGSTVGTKCELIGLCGKEAEYPVSLLLFFLAVTQFIGYFVLSCLCLTTKNATVIAAEEKEAEPLIEAKEGGSGETSNSKRNSLSQLEKTKSFLKLRGANRPKLDFTFQNLEWSFGDKKILSGVHGNIASKQLSAVMGPSGAGKSTLVNILMGKIKPTSGNVFINGQKDMEFQEVCSMTGFVPQDDIMLTGLTVRENIMHSANTRVSAEAHRKKSRSQRVDELLETLGLKSVQHTIVGNDRKRGLSGGERKRVSIALELISDPAALFLDEPTTGLDSASAEVVVNELRSLADSGCTVICILHQPRSSIFHQFDNVLTLSPGGQISYNTEPRFCREYLSFAGSPCPQGKNVEHPKTNENKNTKRDSMKTRILQPFHKQLWYCWIRSCLLQLREKGTLSLYCALVVIMVASLSTGFSPFIQDGLTSVYEPPLGDEIRKFCPPHNPSCNTSMNVDGLTQMMFFFSMGLGAVGMVAGARTFMKEHMLVMKRESAIGLNEKATIIAKMLADLNIISLLSLFASGLWSLMAYPGGDLRWFLIVSMLIYTTFGWGYFVSQLASENFSMTMCMVVACAFSALNGVNPKLKSVSYPEKIIWDCSYSRFVAEAIFTTFTQNQQDNGWPVQHGGSYFGFDVSSDQFTLDIIAVFIQGTVLRILALLLLVWKIKTAKL